MRYETNTSMKLGVSVFSDSIWRIVIAILFFGFFFLVLRSGYPFEYLAIVIFSYLFAFNIMLGINLDKVLKRLEKK